MALDRMLKVKDIQENLGIGRQKAYLLVSMRGFPKLKIGKNFYIPEEQYKKWIAENLKHEILL